ncbi:MAG: DUF1330 domain-containing protein [Myxococcota bacterium]|jgi:uncharacterized protein (DUF1330 family)|nr:DUF1330 domain-containing protein [Myxococcota bacterium]
MGAVEPRQDQMDELLANAKDARPLVMINLLRYRDEAAYEAGSGHEPCSGREAYDRYGHGVLPLVAKQGGRPIWAGSVLSAPIAPEAEAWDDAVIVEYPSLQHFIDMTTSEEYLTIAVHRTAALDDSRLIATQQTLPPREG